MLRDALEYRVRALSGVPVLLFLMLSRAPLNDISSADEGEGEDGSPAWTGFAEGFTAVPSPSPSPLADYGPRAPSLPTPTPAPSRGSCPPAGLCPPPFVSPPGPSLSSVPPHAFPGASRLGRVPPGAPSSLRGGIQHP